MNGWERLRVTSRNAIIIHHGRARLGQYYKLNNNINTLIAQNSII